jgi:hypothetical protein
VQIVYNNISSKNSTIKKQFSLVPSRIAKLKLMRLKYKAGYNQLNLSYITINFCSLALTLLGLKHVPSQTVISHFGSMARLKAGSAVCVQLINASGDVWSA